MFANVGSIDRLLRIALGLSLISLSLWGPQTAWGYIGFLPLMTGLAAYCPLYHIFGISTCRKPAPNP
jgi:hypothetical protein